MPKFAGKDITKTRKDMKNIVQGALLRAVCLLALGVLLIVRSEEMPVWLVKAAGILLIVPGLVSIASLFRPSSAADGQETPEGRPVLLPSMGAAAVGLGLVVFFMAGRLVSLMMYVLAAVLIVASALQCVELQSASRRGARIPAVAYVMPVLVLVAALLVVLDVKFAAAIPFIFIGAGCVVYGLTELWAAIVLMLLARRLAREAEAAAAKKKAAAVEAKAVLDESSETVDNEQVDAACGRAETFSD